MNSFFPLMLTDSANLMNSTLSYSERISLGLQVLLFGMLVVFSVLVLIWAILALFRVIFYGGNKKNKAEPSQDMIAETAPVPKETVPVAEPDDTEIIAVINAALAVFMENQADKPQTSFRVVSFRRTASK